jgi:hypothetical protein
MEAARSLVVWEIRDQPGGKTVTARGREKIRRRSKMISAIPAPLSCQPCEATRPLDETRNKQETQSNSVLDTQAHATTRQALGSAV